jgi:hypothetical protein
MISLVSRFWTDESPENFDTLVPANSDVRVEWAILLDFSKEQLLSMQSFLPAHTIFDLKVIKSEKLLLEQLSKMHSFAEFKVRTLQLTPPKKGICSLLDRESFDIIISMIGCQQWRKNLKVIYLSRERSTTQDVLENTIKDLGIQLRISWYDYRL